MARTKTTESLQAILPRYVSNMKGKKQFQMHVAFYNWEKIVGPQIAKHVKPVRMDFRTLFLYADAPAWAAQLRYMERDLIDKINAYVATELVTSIRYTNYIEKRKQSGFKRNSNAVKASEIIPDSEDLKKAESSCSPIKDKEVRQAAERALAAKEALDKDKKKRNYHACAECGVLCPPNTDVCDICDRKRRERKKDAVRRAISEKPWCSYAELYERFRCTPEMAMEQRLELIRTLARKVKAGDETSDDAKKIVMLQTSLPSEQLTGEKIHNVLSRMAVNLLYNSDGIEKKKPEGRKFTPRKYERRKIK